MGTAPVRPRTVRIPVPGGEVVASRLSKAPASAPTVIALHGITGNGWAWMPVAAALEGRLTMWAPDLRGRAGSREVGPPYGMAAHCDDVIALLDYIGVEKAVLVVHSMGAGVGALWALRAAWNKVYRGGHEVISTIMLNIIALQLTTHLVSGPFMDPEAGFSTTKSLKPESMLSGVPLGGLNVNWAIFATRNLTLNLAARAYAVEHGQAPPNPETLVPEYLPAVPNTPLTDKPLTRFYSITMPAAAQIPLEGAPARR